MAKYKKRADGRYSKQVTIGKVNNKPVRKTIYGKTISELEKNYREFMLLVDRNVVLDDKKLTFGELKQEWYRIRKQGKIEDNTRCSYRSQLNRTRPIDEIKVKDLKRYHIESLICDITNEGKTFTAKAVLKKIENILDYAVENDIILKNPCIGLSVRHKKKSKRVLTEEEKRILDEIDKADGLTLKEKALILLFRYTGGRRGEVFSLHKDDFSRGDMSIHIHRTIVDNDGKPYIKETTKTPAGDRYVPIFLKPARVIFDYLDTVDGYLFLNQHGKVMAVNSMRFMFQNIIKKLGLGGDLTPHCFRHNFITECYYAGVDLLTTQAWAGHEDVSTTYKIYTHLDKNRVYDGDRMNEFYCSQTTVKSKDHNNRQLRKA